MLPTDQSATGSEANWPIWSIPVQRMEGGRRLVGPAGQNGLLLIEPVHGIAGGRLERAVAVIRPARLGREQARWTGCDAAGTGLEAGWLLQAACREAAAWPATAPGPIPVSVGLPAWALRDASLLSQVEAALLQAGLAPALLEVRLDERLLRACGTAAHPILAGLDQLGVGIAVSLDGDAPGLTCLPDRVRVGSVILRPGLAGSLTAHHAARQAAAACIGLAHRLGARAVAVAVDSALQRDILEDLGCDEGQGSLFGRAMPAGRFQAALAGPLDP